MLHCVLVDADRRSPIWLLAVLHTSGLPAAPDLPACRLKPSLTDPVSPSTGGRLAPVKPPMPQRTRGPPP